MIYLLSCSELISGVLYRWYFEQDLYRVVSAVFFRAVNWSMGLASCSVAYVVFEMLIET